MNKAAINKLRDVSEAQNAPERVQGREEVQAVNLSPETIDALTSGFSRELRRALMEIGPILARLTAADLIYNTEQPAQVLDNSIREGETAAILIKRAGC